MTTSRKTYSKYVFKNVILNEFYSLNFDLPTGLEVIQFKTFIANLLSAAVTLQKS